MKTFPAFQSDQRVLVNVIRKRVGAVYDESMNKYFSESTPDGTWPKQTCTNKKKPGFCENCISQTQYSWQEIFLVNIILNVK